MKRAGFKLRAVSNPTRYRILRYLTKHGEANVGRIWFHIKGDQSSVSQHLAVLKKANIVVDEQRGKEVYYCVNESEIERLAPVINEMASFLEMKPYDEKVLAIKKNML